LMGWVAVGWQWLRMAAVAERRLASGQGDRAFLEAKRKTARYFFTRLLPSTGGLLAAIQSGADSVMALQVEEF